MRLSSACRRALAVLTVSAVAAGSLVAAAFPATAAAGCRVDDRVNPWSGGFAGVEVDNLDGTVCTGTEVTPTSAPPSTSPPVDNPFAGAVGYLNPDHVARVEAAADAAGATLSGAMREVARHPTAVWLDSIASITAGRGLRGHLDAALVQQAAAGRPVVVTLVLQNLPNRSCGNLVLNGELSVAHDGLRRYREEYVDPIAAILADPRYASLRVAVVVEPESLHHLLVPDPVPACAEVIQADAYRLGVRHVLDRLDPIPNVYPYLDAANSGLIGFESNLGPAASLYASIVRGTAGGMSSIAGFALNTANYVPVEETLLPDPNLMVGGQPLRSAGFYEWNPVFDAADLVDRLYPTLVSLGFPPSIGFVVDTSRNGWHGPPSSPPGIPTSAEQAVNWLRTDRRLARWNWCNQVGAGLGERPRAAPRAHVDAYMWVKVPGESDGVSDITLPEARQMEPMCDPWGWGPGGQRSGAMAGAPPRGEWFPLAFGGLVRRAYPPL
jgi:cellulose 1,4-beta-cellobiosidase